MWERPGYGVSAPVSSGVQTVGREHHRLDLAGCGNRSHTFADLGSTTSIPSQYRLLGSGVGEDYTQDNTPVGYRRRWIETYGWRIRVIERVYRVPDVSCQHCVKAITDELDRIAGVQSVTVDIESKLVTVQAAADVSDEQLRAGVEEAGYDIAG